MDMQSGVRMNGVDMAKSRQNLRDAFGEAFLAQLALRDQIEARDFVIAQKDQRIAELVLEVEMLKAKLPPEPESAPTEAAPAQE